MPLNVPLELPPLATPTATALFEASGEGAISESGLF
jgi:hypothetical protein